MTLRKKKKIYIYIYIFIYLTPIWLPRFVPLHYSRSHPPSRSLSLCHPWPSHICLVVIIAIPVNKKQGRAAECRGVFTALSLSFSGVHTNTHSYTHCISHTASIKSQNVYPGPMIAGSINVCLLSECLVAARSRLVSMQDVHGRLNRKVAERKKEEK